MFSPFKAILTALAVITLVIAVYLNKIGTGRFNSKTVLSPEVLSEATTQPSPMSQTIPTHSPTPMTVPKPTVTQTTSSLSDFIYPGSTIQSISDSQAAMTSSDSADTITRWYQDKIKEKHFTAKSFVNTSTNGHILNKLAAGGNNINIDVEITKAPSDTVVSIKVGISK